MARSTEWAARVAEWKASGLSARAFAKGRGYSASSLHGWSTKLRREGRGAGEATPNVALARVIRRPSSASSESIVVHIGGARIEVPTGADARTLVVVLEALGVGGAS